MSELKLIELAAFSAAATTLAYVALDAQPNGLMVAVEAAIGLAAMLARGLTKGKRS